MATIMDITSPVTIPVIASSHQGDITRFKSSSVGRQCVANCISCIIQLQSVDIKSLSQHIMDKILDEGDKLYTEIYNKMDVKQHYFLMEDIPNTLSCFGQKWAFQITNEIDIGLSGLVKEDVDSMFSQLSVLLIGDTYAVLMLGSLSYAAASTIICKSGLYYIFDSHSRSPISGMPISDGHAILIAFQSLKELVQYVFMLSIKLHACDMSVTVVSIHPIGTKTSNDTEVKPSSRRVTRSMTGANTLLQQNVAGVEPRKIDSTQTFTSKQKSEVSSNKNMKAQQKCKKQEAERTRIRLKRTNKDYLHQELERNKQRMQCRRQDKAYVQQERAKNKDREKGRRKKSNEVKQRQNAENQTSKDNPDAVENVQKRQKNAEYQRNCRKRKLQEIKTSPESVNDEQMKKKGKIWNE